MTIKPQNLGPNPNLFQHDNSAVDNVSSMNFLNLLNVRMTLFAYGQPISDPSVQKIPSFCIQLQCVTLTGFSNQDLSCFSTGLENPGCASLQVNVYPNKVTSLSHLNCWLFHLHFWLGHGYDQTVQTKGVLASFPLQWIAFSTGGILIMFHLLAA